MSKSRGKRHKLTPNEREGRAVMRRCDGWAIAGITRDGEPIAVGQGFTGEGLEYYRNMALFFATVASNMNMMADKAERDRAAAEKAASNGQGEWRRDRGGH